MKKIAAIWQETHWPSELILQIQSWLRNIQGGPLQRKLIDFCVLTRGPNNYRDEKKCGSIKKLKTNFFDRLLKVSHPFDECWLCCSEECAFCLSEL